MDRRSFLSLSAATVAASALGQSPAVSGSTTPQSVPPVPATGEIHTMGIDSPDFKVLTRDSRGNLFMAEHRNRQRGGPPLHMHPHQDETFCVLEGEYIAEVGGKRFNLRPGDTVLAPRNVPHAWAFVGNGTGKLIVAFTPAGKIEAFLSKISATPVPLQDPARFRNHDMVLLGPPLAV